MSEGPITRGRLKNFQEALIGVMKKYQEENASKLTMVEGVEWHEGEHKNILQVRLEELEVQVDQLEEQKKNTKKFDSAVRAAAAFSYCRYGYSKERFVRSLISAVGIFCLGSGATIIHGIQNLWTSQPPEHVEYAALVIGGSFII